MKQLRGFKYRLYPTEEQKILLAKHFGACRWMYNYALSKKIAYYTTEKKTLSRFEIQRELVELKKQEATSWLSEVNSQSLQASLVNLDKAYTRFFREKKGFPKFKSKKGRQSVQFPQGTEVDFENNKIYLMKFREGVKCKFHRMFEGAIKTVTVSKTKTGKYYVSILVETDVPEKQKPVPKIDKAMGIDLGITSFLVTSNEHKFENPKFLKKSLEKLQREQRRLSCKKKGGKNRDKQRLKVAKLHEKVANQRKDFLHKVSRHLVDDKQVNTYCIETLNVQGMMRNHCLAQSIADSGWHTFAEFLKYKAEGAGKNVLQIGRFEPSSKVCNVCGLINSKLSLKDRIWVCDCDAEHDRDINAARNIRDFAFAKQNLLGQGLPEVTPGETEDYLGR